MLFVFVLLNGLACGLGHGWLMAMAERGEPREATVAVADNAGGHDMTAGARPMSMHGAAPQAPAPMAEHGVGEQPDGLDMLAMKLFGDCAFAGTLLQVVILLLALGWLARLRSPPILRPRQAFPAPRHFSFPALNPQAP
jgi:hypothetical protein